MGDTMKEIMKKYWLYFGIGIILILSLIFYQKPIEESNPIIQNDNPQPTTDTIRYIFVDIKGQVQNPGVYKLEYSMRLYQLINLAGGLTEDANTLVVNLSTLLHDQDVVYIPSINDVDVDIPIINNSSELIDINHDGLAQLITLPGIGEATAQNIIEYRETIGDFNTIEDIMNVSGIGEATFNAIKDLITT